MAVLTECPVCHRKQATKNKACKCGTDLDRAKKAKKVKYWIVHRVDGKQRKELVGTSIKEAQDTDGKRKVQKREHRIFEILPESKMTFSELTEWHMNRSTTKNKPSFDRIRAALANFNAEYGNRLVGSLKAEDLENYQESRTKQGRAPMTIDMELNYVQAMVKDAFYNDMIDGRVLKAFKSVKNLLKVGSNARDRILSHDEYTRLLEKSKEHFRPILIMAYNTGMRRGEILKLRWSHIDRANGFIRLPADVTKERKPKNIPINRNVQEVLRALPRHVHHDYVFTYAGRPLSRINKGLKTVCEKAGIAYGMNKENGARFHDIRASVKTNMVKAGVEATLRNAILGHSQKGMDKFYLRFNDEDLRKAMDQYTAWLDEQDAKAFANVDQTVTQAPPY